MDRPIIFSWQMIRALLEGRKTQTRRVIKPQPVDGGTARVRFLHGDRLWVRETFSECPFAIYYRATEVDPTTVKWMSPIHMPRSASRLTIEVTGVKVERLQEISEEDARQEGAGVFLAAQRERQYRAAFRMLWDSIHGPDAWDANPWVYALTFNVHKCNIDSLPRR